MSFKNKNSQKVQLPSTKNGKKKEIEVPVSSEEEEEDEDEDEEDEEDDDDEEDDEEDDEDDEEDDEDDDDEDDEDEDEDNEFEVQSSESELETEEEDIDDVDDDIMKADKINEEKLKLIEKNRRFWDLGVARQEKIEQMKRTGELQVAKYMNVDDLSSDDEYNSEDNTIGRVPLHWYDAFDHIGYNVKGQKIIKQNGSDLIDMALDNKNNIKKVYDLYNNREVVLSERDLEIIRRIQAGAFAHPEFDDLPEYSDYYSSQIEQMPLSARPEPKSRFIPSKWEAKKIQEIIKRIRNEEKNKENKTEEEDKKDLYLIWKDNEEDVLNEKKNLYHLPAPKLPLPGHRESYNPPEEYLLSKEEEEKIRNRLNKTDNNQEFITENGTNLGSFSSYAIEDNPENNFIPVKYKSLRHIKNYDNFIKERYERCLDLYLCPRKLKKKLNINPLSLLPKLPSPNELKPFPNHLSLQFLGHTGRINSLSLSPDGQYLCSGGEDGTVRVWEIDTGLCKHIWQLKRGSVNFVSWNPEISYNVIAAAAGNSLVLISVGENNEDINRITESYLEKIIEMGKYDKVEGAGLSDEDEEEEEEEEEKDNKEKDEKSSSQQNINSNNKSIDYNDINSKLKSNKKNGFLWYLRNDNVIKKESVVGPRAELFFNFQVSSVSWHSKGDYLSVLTNENSSYPLNLTSSAPYSSSETCSIHQISKGKSHYPFQKLSSNNKIVKVLFHNTLPVIIVLTKQFIKLYHLIEKKLVKKLITNCKMTSSIDLHSTGNHILIGSYDRKVVWFDLDLSSMPYKTLKYHEKGVNSVKYHPKYPLMASASNDGKIHIFHAMVYNDFEKNPLIVPLKVLKGHGINNSAENVIDIIFHPKLPWIFSCGADGVINLFQNI